jgi:NADH-quinone oxidoreductase subunit F
VDLHLLDASATDAELAVIAATIDEADAADETSRVVRGGHDARARRHLLLPALAAVQAEIGWISPGALGEICRRLTVPPAEAYGVATFYALLSTEPRPAQVAHVCDDVGCAGRGAEGLVEGLEDTLGDEHQDAGGRGWQRSGCLGQCDRAPAVYLQRAGLDDRVLTRTGVVDLLEAFGDPRSGEASLATDPPPEVPQRGRPGLRLLRRIGEVDPADVDDFRRLGGFDALREALTLGPEAVRDAVTASGLRGRGGAAFPTGTKWDAVARADGPRYLICNADESEPGTFKDRVLMEGDPFALVEAMAIAGVATGSEQGYLYIRGEYPAATARMRHAIEVAREQGYLGDEVMGSGTRFDIEIRQGQGAYICGEETALMESIEGYRGEPRNKPPFPTTHGLFGRPTVVNNVETLLNVPQIVLGGPAAYAATGTDESTGTRLFCLAGDVAEPGVYEVALGTTLGELLALAGGIPDGTQAILLGGAAGGFVPPDALDLRLTFEDARAAGVALGSGVVMPFGPRADMPAVVGRIASFFRDETCGQCVPCRIGVVRQEEALARYRRDGDPRELTLLADVDRVMTDASICGLGQTAASAVRSAIRLGLL